MKNFPHEKVQTIALLVALVAVTMTLIERLVGIVP